MRLYISLLFCLIIANVVNAQENLTPYQIALQRIEGAETSGDTALYLNNLGLTELPPELFHLHNLQTLYLDHNPLSGLPPEIGN
jgi:Leucine-rich repeat (LRR) protein